MSNPTGNAIKAAAIPDAREARLLALVEKWKRVAIDCGLDSKVVRSHNDKWFALGSGVTLNACASEILAALRGDA